MVMYLYRFLNNKLQQLYHNICPLEWLKFVLHCLSNSIWDKIQIVKYYCKMLDVCSSECSLAKTKTYFITELGCENFEKNPSLFNQGR